MRTTFPVVNNTILQKAGLDRIRSGEILSIKIIDNKNGLIKAVVGGKIITLKGSDDLIAGRIIKVRAQWSGKTLLLNRLDDKNGLKNMISEAGIKNTNLSMLLFETVRRSGLNLNDDNLKLLKRLLRTKKELSGEEARTAAESIKKGLSPEEMTAVACTQNRDDRADHDKKLLFNHLQNGNELWFIIPYNFSLDGKTLEGSIRIQKNTVLHEISAAVIEINFDAGRLFFLIDGYNKKNQKIRFFTDGKIPASTKKQIIKRLPRILGNLRRKYDDNVNEDGLFENCEGDFFDGYSSAVQSVEEVV